MSVRAHRVVKIEYAPYVSFNLWHDRKLVEFIEAESYFYEKLDSSGGGMVEVSVEVLEKAIAEVHLSDEVKQALQDDIDACNERGEEYVQYDCF